MKTAILLSVRGRDYATFQDLAAEVPGFVGDQAFFNAEIPGLILWHACSHEAVGALVELLGRGEIRIEIAPRDCYRTDLEFPSLPVWRGKEGFQLPTGRVFWAPVVIVEGYEGPPGAIRHPRFA